jgi:general secretion pathway protein E
MDLNSDAPAASPDHEASAPRALEALVRHAEQAGASDIHIQQAGSEARVSFRLDGVLTAIETLANPLAERLLGRIKFLARLKTYQDTLPQDGRIDKGELGVDHDVRVATYPTITGEKIVLRLFQRGEAPTLEQLEMPAAAGAEIEGFLRRNAGLMLLTGPAGSGKTTTIYACLRKIAAAGGRHVITIEDPAEQVIPGIMQTEVSEARGLTFAKAARHLLRQDPQVLVIGEIRDDETANLAVRASLTGHLVIATLHAGSCKGVFERLLVMVPDRYAAVSSVDLIVNQRLARRQCPACRGRRCAACLNTGYRGRIPLVEWFSLNDELRRQIRAQGPEAVVPNYTLKMAQAEAIQRGLSDTAECDRVAGF